MMEKFGTTLGDLPRTKNYIVKRESSYDRTGGNADNVRDIKPGEERIIADLKGPGCITHIWTDINHMPSDEHALRKILLRMYWDDEENPSVDTPYGDFFCAGHGLLLSFVSLPFVITHNGRARNCFFQMPFRKSAKIALKNECQEACGTYFYIDYRVYDQLPDDMLYFHAKYRQEFPCQKGEEYVILDAEGRGHYVGCNMSVINNSDGWWGEGDDKFYIDGREEALLDSYAVPGQKIPTLWGTGSEDYFCQAFGVPGPFTSPYFGSLIDPGDYKRGSKSIAYRFHIEDPIPFKNKMIVAIEHGASGPENNRSGGNNSYTSVAYWYQTEPHKEFFNMPPVGERVPRLMSVPK